jgi:hypothetical protein
MNDPILDILAQIRQRPGMYIGTYSAEALYMFLAGYTCAMYVHTKLDPARYREFIEVLHAKYGHGGGGHSWASVLAQSAGGDAAALDLFFAELDFFLQK